MNALHFHCDNMATSENGAHLAAVFNDRELAREYAKQARRELRRDDWPGRVTVSGRVIKVDRARLAVWCVTFRRTDEG